MSFDPLHRWWRRNGRMLMMVALTALVLSRAYVMWRDLPGEVPQTTVRTPI